MLTEIQPDTKIPVEIYQIAENYRVGTPLRLYRHRGAKLVKVLVVLLICVLFLEAWFIYDSIHNYLAGYSAHFDIWQVMLSIAQVSLAFFTCFSFSRLRVYICSSGLLHIDGKKQTAIRWDEIKEIYCEGDKIQRVVKTDGSTFADLRLLSNIYEMSAIIEDEFITQQLSAALAKYKRGETVEFGNIQVNRYGIVDLDDAVTWEQLEDIHLKKDVLSVKYEGEWHTWYGKFSMKMYSPSYIYPPNLPVFVALVEEILDHQIEVEASEADVSL
jgi:hypothetical protein